MKFIICNYWQTLLHYIRISKKQLDLVMNIALRSIVEIKLTNDIPINYYYSNKFSEQFVIVEQIS